MTNASNQARHAILSKLKTAPRTPVNEKLPEWQAWHSDDQNERVARLVACMEASHTEIIRTTDEAMLSALSQCIDDNGFQQVLLSQTNELATELAAQCPEVDMVRYDKPLETWKTELFEQVDASINIINAAIADTGTLALASSENEPRALSLVPPVHIAVLKESDIVSNFTALMASPFWQNAGWSTSPPTNLVLISGPSKTADIQQTLAYGAHGPKRLILFLVKDSV